MSFLAGQAGLVSGLVGSTDGRFDFLSVPPRWLAHGFCTALSLQVLFASLVWASWGRACRVLVQNENSILMELCLVMGSCATASCGLSLGTYWVAVRQVSIRGCMSLCSVL